MNIEKLKCIIEAILSVSSAPLSIDNLHKFFDQDDIAPTKADIRKVIKELVVDSENRGVELIEVANGYRYQARQEYAEWVARLWDEKPPKYSRALLETLSLIAYRQPITRGEIENVRGVSVSSYIVKTLLERNWVQVIGHREVPGRPALYATTKDFLDYFNLKSLDDLPSLKELKSLAEIHPELDLNDPEFIIEGPQLPQDRVAEAVNDEEDASVGVDAEGETNVIVADIEGGDSELPPNTVIH